MESTVALCRNTQAAQIGHLGIMGHAARYSMHHICRQEEPILSSLEVSADVVYSSEIVNNLLLFMQTGLNMNSIQAGHVGKRYNL